MGTKIENDKTVREGKVFAILSYLFIFKPGFLFLGSISQTGPDRPAFSLWPCFRGTKLFFLSRGRMAPKKLFNG